VIGTATNTATVTVNSQATYRKGVEKGSGLTIDSAEEPLTSARPVFLLARPRAALI